MKWREKVKSARYYDFENLSSYELFKLFNFFEELQLLVVCRSMQLIFCEFKMNHC